MAVLFYVIGLELKRELTVGELSNPKTVLLPVAAAFGGALLPVLIYSAYAGGVDPRGWPVPVATDIAFALAGLALTFGGLNRIVGALLVTGLAAYILIVWRLESRGGTAAEVHIESSHTHDPAPQALLVSGLFVAAGLGLLMLGADLLVTGAVATARIAGLSETVIGLTIVATGTSLPEHVATLAATLKGRSDVAFGDIVGSNIYNILGILGVTALIRPFPIPEDVGLLDWGVLVASAALLLVFALTGRRLTRMEGVAFLAAYVGFVYLLLSK
jgi:cation:H+ antiporter